MIPLTDGWVVPGLALLADWSIRWGLVLVPLVMWFALKPPRRTAIRYLLCLSALVAGVLLPITPRWGHAAIPGLWGSGGVSDRAAVLKPSSAGVEGAVARPILPSSETGEPPNRRHSMRETVVRTEAARGSRALDSARPTTESLGAWRILCLMAAVLWVGLVLVMLSRLVCGGWMLARLRRDAEEVGGSAEGLLGECRSALGLSRRVGLAVHRAIVSPVVVGGLRPLVLVPADWRDWPESNRRACLLHELAHLARYDDWAKLVQEVLRAGFFFHPLVRWLLNRLDRERELLCDESVVAQGLNPLTYARLLLDLARRPGRLLPLSNLSRHGWLPFLDRRTVEVRIERLLEDDMMMSRISRLSAPRSLLLGIVAIIVGLGLGGLRVGTVSAQEPGEDAKPPVRASEPGQGGEASPTPSNRIVATNASERERPQELRGEVLDPDGRPVASATIVVGPYDAGGSGHQVLTSDAQGRFVWPVPEGIGLVCVIAHKPGLAPAVVSAPAQAMHPLGLKLRLSQPETFSAVLVDRQDRPVTGAKVRVSMMAFASEAEVDGRTIRTTCYSRVPWAVIEGSPVEELFTSATGNDGGFTFLVRPGSGLRLDVTGADDRTFRVESRAKVAGHLRRMMEDEGFVSAPVGEVARLVAFPAARLEGRVVSTVPDVGVSGLTVTYQDSHPRGVYRPMTNFGEEVRTDSDGRFVIDGLSEGTVNVFVHGEGENRTWTYRAPQDVALKPGETSRVTLELIGGVKVVGTVVEQGTKKPLEGAEVGVYGPFRPRTGAATFVAMTDASGRYHYQLPPGETDFYVTAPLKGYTRLPGEGSSRTVTIADGVSSYEVPPIELTPAVTVQGKVLDARGAPVAGASVVGTCEGGVCVPIDGSETVTDRRGVFHLPPVLGNIFPVHQPARLRIRLLDGTEHDVTTMPDEDGSVVVKLPVAGEDLPGVGGPQSVAPDELAGMVVDVEGKPIEGAKVDAWTWYPGHEAKTDARGLFRIGNLDKSERVEVVVRKEEYTPQLFLNQPTGKPGWVIVLGNKTYFEGQVTGPNGEPVAGALIRANNGPKRGDGITITEIWTEATTGKDGRYRMYAQADVYDIQVRVPHVGVARMPRVSLGADEAKTLDISLEPGVVFRARVVDNLTGKPVPDVRLWHWQHPGIEGRSGADGVVKVADMMPGRFDFQVEAPGYARWWSGEAVSEWNRRKIDETRGGWQRNFDHLDFDIETGMEPVTITVERGVTVSGRVVDPDGHPVAGATVAPALTGTGNSLTGDTRFSEETGEDGTFRVLLPASGEREYNLVAHDGKYGQWRTWANGILPPFRTRPGEAIDEVEIHLTRPATVRGRVLDTKGRPVADREVRASAGDRLENRCYDPTVKTEADGSYELRFIRPGEQFIQVAPFWLDAREAPGGTSHSLTLTAGELKTGVDFRILK